ncbi:MAG: hypothetical protein ACOZF0_20610 [Thermodesulfobacteriota bacterium]
MGLLVVTAVMLVGLPIFGVAAAGKPIGPFLEFPPISRYVEHADFSWGAFLLAALLEILAVLVLLRLVRRGNAVMAQPSPARQFCFPWWGWAGLTICLAGWVLAWTRFPWFAAFQRHTFTLPWLGYILSVNALCRKRSGRSPLTDGPVTYLLLFPVSAGFWWFFEYLNRFVQNWYYVEVATFDPLGYFVFASLSFSTVLPAVLGTSRLLLTFPALNAGLTGLHPLRAAKPKALAAAILALAACGLALIGVFPDYLFSLVWVSPLLVATSLQALRGGTTLFSPLSRGDFRWVLVPAFAALACGFFWELWNVYSLAKWEYAIPFVDRFRIFEMPLLGYGGYLPFGLECLVVICMVDGSLFLPESTRDRS